MKFNSFLELLEYKDSCPFCNKKLTITTAGRLPEVKLDCDNYLLIIPNLNRSSDLIKIRKDGKIIELYSDTALFGNMSILNVPITLECVNCIVSAYLLQLNMQLNIKDHPGFIQEIRPTSLLVKSLNSEVSLQNSFRESGHSSRLIVNNKFYNLEYIDINVDDIEKLSQQIDLLIPFI